MITTKRISKEAGERRILWRRIRSMYASFNRGHSENCFALLDPKLVEQGKVQRESYCDGLDAFRKEYGNIRIFHIRISLHVDASANKHDPRPFAYVYVTWQDDTHGFHMFRERWVKHGGKWYTRVAGLVPNKQSQE